MSMTSTDIAQARTKKTNTPAQSSFQSSDDRQSLDALVDRIAKFIPSAPYVPSIPQDDAKSHHNYWQSSRAWFYDTPFREDEHQNLQYMTFLYQDPIESCIQLHNMDEYDRSASRSQHANKSNGIQSVTSMSSQSSAPKKKMTVGDYIKKQINGGSGLAQRPPQQSKHSETAPSKENGVDEDITKKSSEKARGSAETQAKKPTSSVETGQDSPPLAKKRKISPPPDITTQPQETQSAAPEDDPLNLPSSPVLMDIPSIPVSLDLPSFIKNELFALEKQRSSPDSSPTPSKAPLLTKDDVHPNNKRTDSPLQGQVNGVHSHSTSVDEVEKESAPHTEKHSHAHPAKKSEPLSHIHSVETGSIKSKPSSAVQSQDRDGANGKTAMDISPPLASVKKAAESQDHAHPHPQKTKSISEPKENRPRMRKVIKLKIRTKSARKTLANYLRLPPQPWPSGKLDMLLGRSQERSKESRTSDGVIANGIRAATDRPAASKSLVKPLEKRLRPNDELNLQERANKRLKGPASLEFHQNSATPEAVTLKSPIMISSSAQKQLQSTPRKDLKSVAMQRIGSTESIHTPRSYAQTPPASALLEQTTPRRDPKSEKERQAWKAENIRLTKIGTILKHDAENKDGRGEKNPKLAAVKMLESFLSFLLAFVCSDNAQRVYSLPPELKENTWLSLQKFSHMVLQWAKPFPHLYGLAQQLVTVLHSHIAALASRVPTSQWPSPSMLADTMAQLQHAAASGAHRLPIQELTERYPQTCTKAVDYITRLDCGKPKDYGGEYTVPLNVQSTPLQAVRFGIVFLKEWVQLEKLTHDLELKL